MKTTFRRLGAAARALALMAGFIAAGQTAHAACAGPNGNVGDVIYASNYNTMAFCNGSTWTSMAGGVSVTVNTSGGGAPPAGSSADVQFNSAGALAADTGNFTYSSGLLSAPNISATALSASGAGTFGTINSSGLGMLGSLHVAGGATITGQASITTISSSLIQVGNNGASCTSGLAGGVRYNSTSNTIDYCSGSAWLSLGPSATQVPAFSVNKSGTNQTVTAGASTLLTWSSELFDTNNNFDIGTNRFTPTVPGKYLITLNVGFTSAGPGDYVSAQIRKNGSISKQTTIVTTAASQGLQTHVSAIVDMNGSSDYIEGYAGTDLTTIKGTVGATGMDGILISMAGGGTGGTAAPAGSTNDVQFNSGGVLAADTGNFTYGASTLAAPIVSASTANITTLNSNAVNNTGLGTFGSILDNGGLTVLGAASMTTISSTAVSSSLIQVGSGNGTSCVAGLNGAIRYNSTSNTIDACLGTAWTSLSSGTTAGGGGQGDRITSGTLSIIANTGSAYASLTTNGTTWGYLSSNASFIPYLQVSNLNAGNISTSLIQTGANSTTCSNGIYGSIRWSATSDTIQVCNSGGWVSVASSSVPNTTISQGQNNYGAIFSGPNTLVTDSALYVDRANHRLGIGTAVPSGTLHVTGNGSPYAMFGTSGTGAIELRDDDNASGFFIRNDGVNPVISTKVGNIYLGYGSHSGMALNFYTSNTFAGTWDPNGRLGIGTGSPAYTLDVSGLLRVRNPSASQVMVDTTTTGQQAAVGFYSNGVNKWQIGKNNGDQLFIWDSAAARTAMNVYSSGSMGLMPDGGYVGIGTYTPASSLDVSSTSMRLSTTGGSNTPYMQWYKDGVRQAFMGWGVPGSSFNLSMENNNALYINASQTTVTGQLYAANDILLNNATNNVVFYGSTGVAVPGANSNGEKIQLYGTAGTVGASDYAIGIESGTMWFNGSSYKWYAGAVQKMLLDATGNLTATAFLYSSDKRLKSDITATTGGLAKLDALTPVSFRFTADPSKAIHLGLIAQDVQKVYPEAVKTDDKGFLKLDYPALVGPIIDMLKELKVIVLGDQADIAKLQAANDNLQQEVNALHAANDNLEAANKTLKSANDSAIERLDAMERKLRAHGW